MIEDGVLTLREPNRKCHLPAGVLLHHLDALKTLEDFAGDGRGAATEVTGTRAVPLAA